MPLTLFRPSHFFTQSCPASCDQPLLGVCVCACMRLEGCISVFVKVLARVRGEPSAGHSPPAAPSHSDTVTKGDPQIVLYTSPPPARSDTKTWPGCSQPRSPTGTHMFFSDDTNYQKSAQILIMLMEMKGKCVVLLILVFL